MDLWEIGSEGLDWIGICGRLLWTWYIIRVIISRRMTWGM